jgi:hypothetical protein
MVAFEAFFAVLGSVRLRQIRSAWCNAVSVRNRRAGEQDKCRIKVKLRSLVI